MPTLRPGDIVIMDNLGSHKGKAVRRAIRAAGAKLLLPAEILARPQPDRAGLRQAQASACARPRRERVDTVCDAIGQLLDAFTADECANYFKNAGYGLT